MNAYRQAAEFWLQNSQDVGPGTPSGPSAPDVESTDRPVAPGPTPPLDSAESGSSPVDSAGSSSLARVPREIDQVRQRASLAALHKALGQMVADIDRLAASGDLFGLADGYAELDRFLKAARDVRNHAEDHIARLMTRDRVNLGDEITLERRRGRTRKEWQSVELLRHLVGDQLVNAQTGEDVTDRLVACLPLTGSLSWRTTAFREHGVDPEDWCRSEPARTTVQVRVRRDEDDDG